MIDHIALTVRDYARSKEFYTKVLAPLGYTLIMEPRPKTGGFGKDRKPSFEPPDRRELVRALLSSAPDEAQEVAVLYFVDELSQAEIGEALGRSLPTVRKRLREFLACARGALREAMPGLSLPVGDEL